MRIEYENHQFAPGVLLLWVSEWHPPSFGESVVALLRRDRLALRGDVRRRFYAFDRELGRWLDESKHVVLNTDPRSMRLNEIVIALRIELAVDQVVGL